MVYFKDFSKHQKAPFKGLARKSLIFIFILFYLLEPYAQRDSACTAATRRARRAAAQGG